MIKVEKTDTIECEEEKVMCITRKKSGKLNFITLYSENIISKAHAIDVANAMITYWTDTLTMVSK